VQSGFRIIFKIALCLLIFAAGFTLAWWIFDEPSLEKKSVQKETSRRPPGFWFIRKQENQNSKHQLSAEDMENLASIGYVDGIQAATHQGGVVRHHPDFIQPGLNYYTSGHGPEAFLMESNGEVRHRWKMQFQDAFPDRAKERRAMGARYWRFVHLYPNGDLLAIYEGLGMIKIDKNSKLLWRYGGHTHHQAQVQPDGSIYVLTRKPRIVPDLNDGKPLLEDFITILDSAGKEQQMISIVEAIRNSPYSPILGNLKNIPSGDIFHTNSVQVLDGSLASKMSVLKKGNILISVCFLDMIAVLDPESTRIVWALTGLWSKQHTPSFLQNGDLLVFDNQGAGNQSRVLLVNPLTQQILWKYEHSSFFSEILGSGFRLPNGNTLITDSDDGRAFEVTADHKIVWEFFNPHRAGTQREFVAVIPELARLPPDFNLSWLN
jgi:hypothetical protein